MQDKKPLLGGQAVIEGVMIKSGRNVAVAVRKENGSIVTKTQKLKEARFKFLKWPFVRGTVNLVEMLVIGIRTLVWSANQAAEEEEEFTTWDLIWLLGLSFGFAIVFFIALPYVLTDFFGVRESSNPVMFNLVDGLLKILIFIIYVVTISFMKDVRRLFEYHGAEHKAVLCYESGKEVTIENCKPLITLHPRCGTAFVMIVFAVSILVFSLIPVVALHYFPGFAAVNVWMQKLILFPIRIACIPIIAGIAYELLKIAGKHERNILARLLILPGLLLQRITTKEPDEKQLEVAIKSVNLVLSMQEKS